MGQMVKAAVAVIVAVMALGLLVSVPVSGLTSPITAALKHKG